MSLAKVYQTYRDRGHGVTDRSLQYWRSIRYRLGNIKLIVCYKGDRYPPTYNTVVWDDQGNTVMLSGFSCGYGGTGPHGLLSLLESEGFNVDFQKEIAGVNIAVFNRKEI